MFNDERITIESGKIFKKANVLAIIISVLFLFARICVYIKHNDPMSVGLFSTEILTILTASIILLYGELAFKDSVKDERILTEKNLYYSKHGKTLLIWILVGYSISMISSFNRSLSDVAPNYIIFIFQSLGAVYFYYMFKKNQININYTFIENDKKSYYKHVWKLIGYLALIISLVYLSCGLIALIIYQTLGHFLVFVLAAITSIIGLGLQYLFLSFLEKKDYDIEEDKIKPAFLISGIIVVITYLTSAICSGIVIYVANNGLVQEMGSYLAYATNVKNNIGFISTTYLGVSLSYLLSYCLKNKNIKKTIMLFFIMLFVSTLSSIVTTTAIFFILDDMILLKYYQINTYINTAMQLAFIVIFGLLVYFIIKEKELKKSLILIPIIELILFFVAIFLSTQGDTEKFVGIILNPGYKTIGYLLFYLLLYTHKEKELDIKVE